MPRRSRRIRIIATIALGLACSGPAAGQDPGDLLARDREAAAVAAQVAESNVAQAIQDAERLALTSRPHAAAHIKKAMLDLDLVVLGTLKRDELKKRLEAKLAHYEGKATIVMPDADPSKLKEAEREATAKARQETDEVAKGIAKANDLFEQNRHAEAGRVVAELRAKYPKNPAVLALKDTNLTAANLNAWRKISEEQAQAWVVDHRNIMRSAIPANDDIQFPDRAKWKELTELRRKANVIQLSEREKAILESLNTVVTVVVKDRPFQEAIQEFSNQIKQEIHLDAKSLEDAGLEMNRRTNFTGNVSARTALRALLQPQGLTYVVKGEMIQVVTLEKAEREMLTTRQYDVSDIVGFGGQFSNAVQWGPNLAYQQTMQNAAEITRLVRESIDPRCWKERGGFCSIEFYLPTRSLIVRASTEVHAALGASVYGK